MRTKYILFAFLVIFTITANASDRFVPPPGPEIVDGPKVAVDREVNGLDQIIHIKRDSPAPFTQFVGNYLVDLECTGENPLSLNLQPRTSPFGSPDEELVFLTLPKNSDANCTLTVTSRNVYPWQRRFSGLISSIPVIKD